MRRDSLEIRKTLDPEPPQHFWEQKYYAIMFSRYGIRSNLTLKVPLECSASELEVVKRRRVLNESHQSDLNDVEQEVRLAWARECEKAPKLLQQSLSSEPSQEFWETHYYTTMLDRYSSKDHSNP